MAVNSTGENFEMPMNMSHLKAPNIMESEMHLISHTNLKMDQVNNCASFIFTVDIEKGNADVPNSVEQSTANSDDSAANAFQKEISLRIGGRYMQLFTNYALQLLKITDNKTRKYKRSATFNARRLVLLFSVMSSMGTIILIYLTLRAKQISDGV